MNFPSNLHTHTVFCDGKSDAFEFVEKAIELGFVSLGFSCHSNTGRSQDVCITPEKLKEYHPYLAGLKAEYSDRIQIYTGRELDRISDPDDGYDYDFTIGAVHFVCLCEKLYCIDNGPEIFSSALAVSPPEHLVAEYYRELTDCVLGSSGVVPDIIAHFDIILLEGKKFFDPNSGWYKNLAIQAADAAIGAGVIIEINTGGLCRGFYDDLYPTGKLLDYMVARGADFTLGSDAHHAGGLDFHFPETIDLLRNKGVKSLKILRDGDFYDYMI
ncbi:MAG: histidinol-phosphatase HisJ family protein [Oscillospiraceae bacterium]|nr:histidinol-phosphatase HisJ family protein [Oscillospiraceae bacterium]